MALTSVRAKFVCNQVTLNIGTKTATLQAVTNGSEENKSFSAYTPTAQLQIGITNDTPAADFFEVGKEYYLDFTPAEK